MWKKNNSFNDSKRRKEEWHYLAVKKLCTLWTIRTSWCFYCLNCCHSFRTENKIKSHKKSCKNKDLCGIVMPSEKDKILEFNQYMKSDKMQYIIYADMESLFRKINRRANNPKKIFNHKNRCKYSLQILNVSNLEISSYRKEAYFISFKNLYEKVLYFFKRTRKKCNWFWIEKNVTVNKRRIKSYQDAKVCYICEKNS